MLKSLYQFAMALLVGGLGGTLFFYINAPLPWTLGALAASAVAAIAGAPWAMPHPARDLARPVVGVLAGSAFTSEVLVSAGDWWPAVLFVLFYAVFISTIGFFYYSRLCKLDPVTAFFSSTPGGLSEFTLVGSQLGGDMRTLVMNHAVRIVMIVFIVPFVIQTLVGQDLNRALAGVSSPVQAQFPDWLILVGCGLAGYLLAKRFKLPGGVLLAAMLLSAFVHAIGLTEVRPPYWLVAVVQVVVGSIAGSRFAGITLQEVKATISRAVIWGAILLGAAALFGFIGAKLFGREFAALLLALAPGGMQEMTIISYALGIETAFVITCHVCRSTFVLASAPAVFRLLKIAPPPPST